MQNGLWFDSSRVLAVAAPKLEGEHNCDVAIIGGGFTGLSAALHLADSGVSVTLVEAHEIGSGASGRNGGQVNPGLKLGEAALIDRFGEAGRLYFRLGEEATGFLADLVKRKALDCNWTSPGVLRLSHSAAALDSAKAACEILVKGGIGARILDREETAHLVGSTRYVGGLLDPRGGSVHPLDLVRSLGRAAVAAGANIHEHSRAMEIQLAGKSWCIVTPQGRLTASRVIVATNGYSDNIVPGLSQSLLPVNSFQVATAPLPVGMANSILPGGHTAYDSRRLILYFRKSPDGRVVLGGRASFSSRRIDEDERSDYSVLRKVLDGLFPQLQNVPITHNWSGLVCLTQDFLPHYHKPAQGLHVLVGYNGRGVALSIRAGAWLGMNLAGKSQDVEMPATTIRPIPMHGLRAPVLNMVMYWNKFLDSLGK